MSKPLRLKNLLRRLKDNINSEIDNFINYPDNKSNKDTDNDNYPSRSFNFISSRPGNLGYFAADLFKELNQSVDLQRLNHCFIRLVCHKSPQEGFEPPTPEFGVRCSSR